MNWLDIDKVLQNIIMRHIDTESMLKEAEAQFKWNRSQSEAALLPLLKRHNARTIIAEPPKKQPKSLRKR